MVVTDKVKQRGLPGAFLPGAEHWDCVAEEVHLWCVPLDQMAGQWQTAVGILSADERNRASRFRQDRHKSQYIIGRAILRKLLGWYLSREPERVQFEYGPQGKPSVKGTNLHFNKSDSGNWALYAFTRERRIGVDIERVRALPEMEAIAKRFFSRREHDVLNSLPASQQQEGFFRCWTRKEAFIKALGGGLSIALDRFDVSLLPGHAARVLRVDSALGDAADWSLTDMRVLPGVAAAIAVEGRLGMLRQWFWSDQVESFQSDCMGTNS